MMIDFDIDTSAKLQEIINKLGAEEILSQLTEECCELGQAAQKMRRALHGTTPVTLGDAISKLEEETGDVLLLIECLNQLGCLSELEIEGSIDFKLARWYGRTFPDK